MTMIFQSSSRRRCKHAKDSVERRCYPKKRPGFAPSPSRSLRKRDDQSRSRFEEEASEIRREQEQYAQRRRAFFAWADVHAETLGTVLPVRRSRTEAEIRFANVNPAVSFSISATSICVTVSRAGECCDLRVFDSAPRRAAGGYEDDSLLPEYVVVYPDLHALWQCEVFDRFRLWYAAEFATATELLLLCDERGRCMSAALYPGKYVSARQGDVSMPLFTGVA
jgi:hypothetical protein